METLSKGMEMPVKKINTSQLAKIAAKITQ